ncbi:DNA topoisomerase family protein [Clostridium senegalense]|uniref:DNA topoisomerase family protein n=1 Tax=Clostridium senegalense TaxID=1465809 RepID=UPI00399D6A1D
MAKELDVSCPKCGKKILEKRSRKGRTFYGCSGYPECDFVSWFEPSGEKCPECNDILVKRYTKTKGNYLECANKECKYRKELKEEIKEEEN